MGRDVSAVCPCDMLTAGTYQGIPWVPRELGAEPQVFTCTRQRERGRNEGRAEGDCNMAREGVS